MTRGRASSARHQVVPAGQGDIGILSLVIAEAFFSLAVSRWLIPDGPARRAVFPGYFRLYLEHAIADGLVQTTPDRAGAALWIPGDGPGKSPDGYAETLAALTGQHLSNFLAFDEQLDRHHPAGTHHHHLAILAVRPDRQGQGIGTALLHAHHAVLEEEGVPAYLEASDERTRRLYLGHGYADRGSSIDLADGVRMYPMWREPVPDNARPQGEGRRICQPDARAGPGPEPEAVGHRAAARVQPGPRRHRSSRR